MDAAVELGPGNVPTTIPSDIPRPPQGPSGGSDAFWDAPEVASFLQSIAQVPISAAAAGALVTIFVVMRSRNGGGGGGGKEASHNAAPAPSPAPAPAPDAPPRSLVPCDDSLSSTTLRAFMHMEWPHLLSNLFGLFVLSRVEKDVGSAWFLVLLATIAAVAVAIEKLVKSQTKIKVPCSIGFSGVLIGLAAWEGLVRQKWETSALLATAGMVIGPSLSNPRASLTGHAFGAIAGIVVAAATTLVISGKKNGIAAPSK